MSRAWGSRSFWPWAVPLLALGAFLLSLQAAVAATLDAPVCLGRGCDLLPLLEESRFAGMPLAAWGCLYFLQIGWLSAVHAFNGNPRHLVPALAVLIPGLGMSAFKTWQLLMVLRIPCPSCLTVHLLNVLIAAGLIGLWRRSGNRGAWRGDAGSWISTAALFVLGTLAVPPLLRATEARALQEEIERFRREPQVGLRNRPGLRIRGADDSTAEFVVVTDFACPACSQLKSALRRLTDPGLSIRLLLSPHDDRLNPLRPGRDEGSVQAARIAIAAAGRRRLEEIQDDLFDHEGTEDQKTEHFARRLGMDPAALRSELAGERIEGSLRAHAEATRDLGIRGVPELFLEGRRIPRWGLPGLLEALLEWTRKK
jgi:predicted DsbA family dithiol-disulfide isomerase